MNKKLIAETYIDRLEKGDIEGVISLFSYAGIVISPLYGKKSASDFYKELANDTKSSELEIKTIFENEESNSVALYFNYKWTLANGALVVFDVVDILIFDDQNKVTELRIIYDTDASKHAYQQF